MWLVYALLAASVWGLDYAISEEIFKFKISPITLLTFELLIGGVIFFFIFIFTHFKNEVGILVTNRRALWLTVALLISFNVGNFLIFLSIQAKNATLAGLVELSYPFFAILFSWLLFNTNHLTPAVIAGALLTFAGILIMTCFGG